MSEPARTASTPKRIRWGIAGVAIAAAAVGIGLLTRDRDGDEPATRGAITLTVGPDGKPVVRVVPEAAPPPADATPRDDGAAPSPAAVQGAEPEASAPGAPREVAPPAEPRAHSTTRWYENRREGQKLGWLRVVWSPSMWEGKRTVHDTTTVRTREAREMLGTEDVFATETVSDLERGEDGELWWMKSVTTENGGRVSTAETTWVGDGYEHVSRLNGVEERHRVKTSAPAHVDAEAFLGARIAAKRLKEGDRLTLRVLDVRGERVLEHPVVVGGADDAPGPDGNVRCTRVVETDPETGGTVTLWIDPDGAVARVKDLATEIVRVPEGRALERPLKTASFSITCPATPHLQRIFSAERLLVDVHVRPDPDRPLPDFPASPWSRVTSVDGDDVKGYVAHVELKAYDAPDAKATIPVKDPAFAKDLEPTLLMPCGHPDVVAATRRAVGDETDARRAATRIAEFVYTLQKESGDVAEATAVEILRDHKGDCSEHALLFVAMCRAAGIPARRCSGFVCIGDDWGAHAWAEIWTGAWIGVDPTTDDVGTAARYLFYGYSDEPSSRLATVSVRARGRVRFVTRRLEEGDDRIDFGDATTWRVLDASGARSRHLLAGLEFRGVPAEWKLSLSGDAEAVIRVPEGRVFVRAQADQGLRTPAQWMRMLGDGEETTFAGAPALRQDSTSRRFYVVGGRRRIVVLDVRVKAAAMDAVCARLEKVMAASFTPKPKDP